ncbi:hypothetical protein ASF53_05145 [Methylobacterium sp. Leaf123]|nr:hypothetical protein ASF53_05145 [Methylobacterium sp. Leaf123]
MLTARAEARELVEIIAGPLRMGENVKAALSRVARVTGLGDRRVRGIWHSEARSIRADEMDRLRIAARDARELELARDEYSAVISRIAACDAALGVPPADPARAVDHGRVRVAGAEDRALARGEA